MGRQGLVHAHGELATARTAVAVGVPMIWSPPSSRFLEDAADAGDEEVKQAMFLASQWLKETGSGAFRTWDDLRLSMGGEKKESLKTRSDFYSKSWVQVPRRAI